MLHKWIQAREGGSDAKGIEIDERSMSECQSRSASYCIGNEGCFNKRSALLNFEWRDETHPWKSKKHTNTLRLKTARLGEAALEMTRRVNCDCVC